MHILRPGLLVLVALGLFATPAAAQQNLNITIENNQSAGGFYLTPLWYGIHDGSFDYFDANNTTSASSSLQMLAEGGVTAGLDADFDAAQPAGQRGVIISPGGFAGAPVIDPGEVAMSSVTVNDPLVNQFFSYSSMVIPTNDAFIGNSDGTAHQLFDAAGNFTGPLTIQVFGSSIYDAGTEANDENGDAAFSANGGTRTGESLFVRAHPGLGNFVGTFTVAGTEITSDIAAGELLATITITQAIPEPGSMAVLGMASAMLFVRRRKR